MASLRYRPEIDGIRAIAVASVILFHAGLSGFDGGFIGVDIFFVISGFLITSIILRERDQQQFSLIGFYERRARRILPALFVVMAVSVPFAFFVMLPYELVDFGQSVIATMLFVSNFLFFLESDYFAPDAALKPLLHTWSLAVEEQFYLVYPLSIGLLWGLGRQRLALVLGALAVASLGLAEVAWRITPAGNFFLAPTRIWELLIGALVAFSPGISGGVPRALREGFAALGLVLALGSVALLSKTYPHPSLFTLPAVAGSALMLSFATSGTVVARLLSAPPLIGLGLISYSAYLWHHPVFAFTKLALGEKPAPWLAVCLVILTITLAYLTWKFIETPFRDREVVRISTVWRSAATATVVSLAIGLAFVMSAGFVNRYPAQDRQLALYNQLEDGKFVKRGFRQFRDARFDADETTPNVLIVGDSYAEDFVNMSIYSGALQRASVSTLYIPKDCGAVLRKGGHTEFISLAQQPRCTSFPGLYGATQLIAEADVIILSQSWQNWAAELIATTLTEIRAISDARVIVVGRKSFGPIKLRDYLAMTPEARLALRNSVDPDVVHVNALLRDRVGMDSYVDIPQIFCGVDSTCPLFTAEGALISGDGWHLTVDGAKVVGEAVFRHSALAPLK